MAERNSKYRGYTLVAREANRVARCWAWKDKVAVHKAEGATLEQAMLAARQSIDEELGFAQRDGTKAEEEYLSALEAIMPGLSASQIKMLQAHYHASGQTITASQLAVAAGYSSFRGANLQYGLVGKALLEQHPVEVPKDRDGKPVYTFALADAPKAEGDTSVDVEEDPEWRWQMLPALAYALRALGVVKER